MLEKLRKRLRNMIKDKEAELAKVSKEDTLERFHIRGVLIGLYTALNASLTLDITTNDDIESVAEWKK